MSGTKPSIIGDSTSTHPTIIADNQGSLNERKIVPGGKPIFIVFIVLGVVSVGVLGVGIAALGGHQGWWSVGGLTNLSHVNSIVVMSIGTAGGIIFLMIGIIGTVKKHTQNAAILPIESHPLKQLQLDAHSTLDASYDHEDSTGIIDLVYCNAELGYGCVVDGTGHNNPNMRTALKAHFDPFMTAYAKGLANVRTFTELHGYFTNQIRVLEGLFRNRKLPVNHQKIHAVEKKIPLDDADAGTFLDATYKPAMSFAQLMQVGNRLQLLTAQAADTMIVVEMLDRSVCTTQQSTAYGVGDERRGGEVKIKTFDITGAKRVIGFSDGIGEFLTFEEITKIITSTTSDQLFARLKEKVMTPRPEPFDWTIRAANGVGIELYKRGKPDHEDDMSLFILEVI